MEENTPQQKEEKIDNSILETNEEQSLNEEQKNEENLFKKIEEEKDKYIRLAAEFENYKKRVVKERIEIFKTAGEEILIALLPILDDFERGIKELSKTENQETLKGIELIYSKLSDTLKNKGLKKIEIKPGDDFDVDKHEAITQIAAPNESMINKIIDIIEEGYLLSDKIIRYPKVVIGK